MVGGSFHSGVVLVLMEVEVRLCACCGSRAFAVAERRGAGANSVELPIDTLFQLCLVAVV